MGSRLSGILIEILIDSPQATSILNIDIGVACGLIMINYKISKKRGNYFGI